MRFVKASDRIPKSDDPVHAKIDGVRSMGNFFNDSIRISFYVTGSACDGWVIPPSKFNGLEWLDESLPSSVEQEAERLYPYHPQNDEMYTDSMVTNIQRSAHITAARMYMGEGMKTAIFPIQRLKNGAGHSNLTLITEEAIPDVYIGSLLLVPFVDGYKDPVKVEVMTDNKGQPIATNLRTCIVIKYIYT